MTSGIYRILCKPTRKCYVGSTVNFRLRFKTHRVELNRNRHHSSLLQNAWNKYGQGAFQFEILKEVEKEHLLNFEQGYINLFDSANRKFGFNVSPTAGNCLGVKHSHETRAKVSASGLGRKFSSEHKKKIADALKGKKKSSAAIAKVAAALTGRKQSAEQIAKRVAANTGQKRSDETRARMSVAAKGNRANLGRTFSAEHRAKIGAAITNFNRKEHQWPLI